MQTTDTVLCLYEQGESMASAEIVAPAAGVCGLAPCCGAVRLYTETVTRKNVAGIDVLSSPALF